MRDTNSPPSISPILFLTCKSMLPANSVMRDSVCDAKFVILLVVSSEFLLNFLSSSLIRSSTLFSPRDSRSSKLASICVLITTCFSLTSPSPNTSTNEQRIRYIPAEFEYVSMVLVVSKSSVRSSPITWHLIAYACAGLVEK